MKESEQKYRELEQQFQRYRESHSVPEAKLHAELIALTNQNANLEKLLDTSVRKRDQLRAQLYEAREEIARLQQVYLAFSLTQRNPPSNNKRDSKENRKNWKLLRRDIPPKNLKCLEQKDKSWMPLRWNFVL